MGRLALGLGPTAPSFSDIFRLLLLGLLYGSRRYSDTITGCTVTPDASFYNYGLYSDAWKLVSLSLFEVRALGSTVSPGVQGHNEGIV